MLRDAVYASAPEVDAFSVDPYGKDIMFRPPKHKDEQILPPDKLATIALLGLICTVIALSIFSFYGGQSDDPEEIVRGQTIVFNFIVFYEVILVFVIRQGYKVPLFSNKWVWGSVVLSFLLQAIIMYTPLYAVFKIAPLTQNEIIMIFAGGLLIWLASFPLQPAILKVFGKNHASV